MFENFGNFFKKVVKPETIKEVDSKDAAKERLHLVLMQDRANVSADFLELMKQEIIDVIKKYIVVDERAIDVRLTNQANEDGTNGAPSLYANIPIINIKNDSKLDKIKDIDTEELNEVLFAKKETEILEVEEIKTEEGITIEEKEIILEDNENKEENLEENKEIESQEEAKEKIEVQEESKKEEEIELEEEKEQEDIENEDLLKDIEDLDDDEDDDDVTFDDLLKAAEEEDAAQANLEEEKEQEENKEEKKAKKERKKANTKKR